MLSTREAALLSYFYTIATDPRIRSARTPSALLEAVVGCIREDFPAVGRHVLGNLAEHVVKPAVSQATSRVVDSIFSHIGAAVAGRPRR